MPSPPCADTVEAYVQHFGTFPTLKNNGFSFLIDGSGKLFKSTKPALKDVELNIDAIHAVMLATRGKGRFSSHLLKACILSFYEKKKLFPNGMVAEMECIQAWSLKMGLALQRLASRRNYFLSTHCCNMQLCLGKVHYYFL
jgi:hypothetical protein